MKYLKLIAATILYGLMLLCIYFIHVSYFKVSVVFYSAILDAVIAAVVTLGLSQLIKWFRVFSAFETIQFICIWLLLGYSFAISVPTVIDRSLSFYILEKLFFNLFFDFQKKKRTIIKVESGETYSGILKPKLSKIIMMPSTKIEYIAPFFK